MDIYTIDLEHFLTLRKTDPDLKIVDVLDEEQYRKGHIPGAINIPVDKIDTRHSDELDDNDKIVVYCASFECQASTKAAEKLIALGYNYVLDYKGGIKEYTASGRDLATGLFQHEKASIKK